MIKLIKSLRAWNSQRFETALEQEIAALQPEELMLKECISQGSYTDTTDIAVSVYSSNQAGRHILVSAGVFFTEIIASCGCGNEPVSISAFCTLRISIDTINGDAVFTVAPS